VVVSQQVLKGQAVPLASEPEPLDTHRSRADAVADHRP
jgi:hypothetical protein